MKGKKRIFLGVPVVVIGLPVVFVLTVLAWGAISDRTNGTIVSSGVTRRYLLYVPNTYDGSKPAPLIISLHPAATWPAFEMNMSRWNALAEQYGFIVVYPAGSGAFFDTFTRGASVWPGGPHTLPRDVRFISDLIDKLEAEYNLDPRRIYANGMSNGGAMAFALGCELPDRIAAVGVVGAAGPPVPGGFGCGGSQPMPTIAFHGTADKFAPYLGRKSPVSFAPKPFPNIPNWAGQVARRNQCQGDPNETRITANVRLLAYTNCAADADVALYTIEGGGHTWPGGKPLPEWIAGRTTEEVKATPIMWEFFRRHPLRPK